MPASLRVTSTAALPTSRLRPVGAQQMSRKVLRHVNAQLNSLAGLNRLALAWRVEGNFFTRHCHRVDLDSDPRGLSYSR
jgi:hypothetical protein